MMTTTTTAYQGSLRGLIARRCRDHRTLRRWECSGWVHESWTARDVHALSSAALSAALLPTTFHAHTQWIHKTFSRKHCNFQDCYYCSRDELIRHCLYGWQMPQRLQRDEEFHQVLRVPEHICDVSQVTKATLANAFHCKFRTKQK